MSECFICVRNQSLRLGGKSSFKSRSSSDLIVSQKISALSKLDANKVRQPALFIAKIKSVGKVKTVAKLSQNIIGLDSINNGRIKAKLNASGNARVRARSASKLFSSYTDKFAGQINIKDFNCVQKLYPIRDITTSLNNSFFINKVQETSDLYQSIDEGIFTGNYNEHLNKSNRIVDDDASYIQPSSVFTSGTFRYKCEVTRPYHHPSNTFFFLRASAPLSNYGANIPPEYRIHNIKLEDPSGNLIAKYKEFTLRGDADYSERVVNYATYISEPEINNANLYSWQDDYPILSEPSGYTLSMDFDIICLDDPFDPGFNKGYEERACEVKFVETGDNDYLAIDGAPLSTHTQGYHLNPSNTIRISAIEICNSGDLCGACEISGIKRDNYFNFYTNVDNIGQRLTRVIYPVEILTSDHNVDVYPETYSTWLSSEDFNQIVADNTTASGANVLTSKINSLSPLDFITLAQSSPVSDSGRLTLRFSHQPPKSFPALRSGAFDLSKSEAFDRASLTSVTEFDNFFSVDSVELKIIAKKAAGSRDYVLDVVGYSDDKILNVTPKIGAFLQNTEQGAGNVPLISGFNPVEDLAISAESISDKAQYYEDYLTSVDAGDHYKLSSLPVVNSTSFQEYTIPLTIYEDFVTVGKSKDYSLSSYFENLFVDLYPIPSGATISSIRMIVHYKPSNGVMLHTLGTPTNKELATRDITLLPIGREKGNDVYLNSDFGEAPLSLVSGIPHAYGQPTSLKTNYSRRWRGVDGNIVNGPYNPEEFDFSFNNPEADHPFLDGYFDLTNVENKFLLSNYSYAASLSGYYNGSEQILKNIGLRLKSDSLFPYSTPYTTIDWTQSGDPLYGKVCDAYDSAIRLSGVLGNINFGNAPISSGFAIYFRFSPDYNMSGVDYNLYNSGILWSKWSKNKDLEIALGFENGYITVFLNDDDQLVKITDSSHYSEYQYPLSTLITYDDSGTARLYCNNELTNDDYLRGYLTSVDLKIGDSDLVFGYSSGSGVGSNIFAHEIGISASGNIVNSSPRRLFKQTTASNLLDSHSHSFSSGVPANKFKLNEYVDEDVSSWKLGSYKICAFSPDFDSFTKRIGKDYLIHYLKHDGSPYDSQVNNINLSGIAYHSQIENDFLRFNLKDVPEVNEAFYSTKPRICKTIPRGYEFTERAIVVDTIIEHQTQYPINWSDGSVGPKLIVSLYTKNQDPVDRPSKINWGLVNRSIHYLEPSGCYTKISSTFNPKDFFDSSEPWANFDLENAVSEFDQKYYSKDIDDMFLQYDLVYPSGNNIDSNIKVHTLNARLEDALVYWTDSNNQFNLYASGESISYGLLNTFTYGSSEEHQDLTCFIDGSLWPQSSGSLDLSIFGVVGIPNNNVNLFLQNSGIVTQLGPDLFVSGGFPRAEQSFNLVMTDNILDQIRTNSFTLFSNTKGPGLSENTMPLVLLDSFRRREFFQNATINLFTHNQQIIVRNSENSVNFFINTDIDYVDLSGTFNLVLLNYPPRQAGVSRQSIVSWNTMDIGSAIDPIIDSGIPFLDANDEIRGVELSCFGNCNSLSVCKEQPIRIHDINWYFDETCLDGGIFRARNTYTNLQTSGFKTEIGYSGHFYGIRKYDGLIPNAPYNIILTNRSGGDEVVELPTRFLELDYGSNQYVNYSGVKFAADKDLDESERQQGNKYGKSVAVKQDLIAVGAPLQDLSYQEYDSNENLVTSTLEEAGAVFLYRRDPRPTGFTWPEDQHKSEWKLEAKLTLPSGILKDYPTEIPRNNIGNVSLPFTIFERFWNIGQEGRQFGHSVALGINNESASFQENKKEIAVVGAPLAKFSRQFEELNASGVSIGLILFTDEFLPEIVVPAVRGSFPPIPGFIRKYNSIISSIQNKDLLFNYFSDPPVKFDVKIIICEPLAGNTNTFSLDFPEPKPSFITKGVISRNEGITRNELNIFSGIKALFEQTFPYDESKLNNNIPSMLGIYVDQSRSLGNQAINPGLDTFLSYYQQYSFASGLRNFYNVPVSGSVYKLPEDTVGEDWINTSIVLLDNLLDPVRLNQSNDYALFTSGVGPEFANLNLNEFNHPPASGGRVFIFEKESGHWNLIQEIKSQVDLYDINDRFGHSVSISDNTEIIAVGSPYMNECCKIYQYNNSEKRRLFANLYSWVIYENSKIALSNNPSNRYTNLISDYEEWTEKYGFNYANEILYSNITATEKFKAREYLEIEEYENIFTYSYGDIPYKGEKWLFIADRFAPSSRLGYSCSVNEDGSMVAFGAPTDSFNIFDDKNVYGADYPDRLYDNTLPLQQSWKSDTNSGAVRLFDSRRYYPHTSVVEYGKFGNLQQSFGDPLDSGHFDYLANIFSDKTFRKMSEDEITIPEGAGLTFIITPGVDALSDEVMSSIINWLALGDRNLVLVGNDPTWENDGAYKISNDVINKILDRLNSRMRIRPARNFEESLPSGKSIVLPSFKPANGISSYVKSYEMNTASGVGDIRIHFPSATTQTLVCNEEDDFNSMCQLPLAHEGDLRAQWLDYCLVGSRKIPFEVNWPLRFGTYQPFCGGGNVSRSEFELPERDPVPLLVAGLVREFSRNVPAVPPTIIRRPIFEQISRVGKQRFEFVNDQVFPSSYFFWTSQDQNYISYNSNINEIQDNDPWFTPSGVEDRTPLLQSRASSFNETSISLEKVADLSIYCAEETLSSTVGVGRPPSKIITIAGVITESEWYLYKTGRGNNNVNFYANMVSKTRFGESLIAQLGGWTGVSSFADGYEKSILAEIFRNSFNEVDENVSNINSLYDVCWISNPKNIPSSEDIVQLKSWLNLGNKKLIITHDSTIDQIIKVDKILQLLGSKIKTLYLPVKEEYPIIRPLPFPGFIEFIDINPNHPISNGFDIDRFKITSFDLNSYGVGNSSASTALNGFIPFEQNGIVPIAYFSRPINDNKLINTTFMKINSGVDKISFPSIAGSGYKILVNYSSENFTENLPIDVYFSNVIRVPNEDPNKLNFSAGIYDDKTQTNFNIPNVGYFERLSSINVNQTNLLSFNVQALGDTIDLYINAQNPRINNRNFLPKTIRLISVSGSLLPINALPPANIIESVMVGTEPVIIDTGRAAQIVVERVSGPIQSFNDPYCVGGSSCSDLGWDGQLIADGPVVVAQEIEFVTDFSAGVNRSRITIIADSNLVQGRYMADEFGRISPESNAFIRSLYPETNFPLNNAGRQYNSITKIVSPERGSPQKYASLSSTGISKNFGPTPFTMSPAAFNINESSYDPGLVKRPQFEPWGFLPPQLLKPEIIEEIIQSEIQKFVSQEINRFGGAPMFSGVINNKLYLDVGLNGGIPEIMKDTGKDYLDFDVFLSGYPGDLFGYSIDLKGKKLVVGSPFSAFSSESVSEWSSYISNFPSGINFSNYGGAGSVYVFEKTLQGIGVNNTIIPWEFIQKLRPKEINIGTQNNPIPDQFGYSVSIDSDIILVGAPGHDFGKYIENVYDSGSFIRKAFNEEFDIPERIIVDLGSEDNRQALGSGQIVNNNGAVFAFENNISEWTTRTQRWTFIEKIIPDSGNRISNDCFGRSISVHRSFRTDSDYVTVVGAENHPYSSSGINLLNMAGAAYSNDIMLRVPPPVMPNLNTYVDTRVFGERGESGDPALRLITNNSIANESFSVSGIIYTNERGAIFVEVSGQDPTPRGFIQHRPYVLSVEGKYFEGENQNDNMTLFIDGNIEKSQNVNLFVGSTTGNVYNTLGLNTSSVIDFGVDFLSLYTDCPEPTEVLNSGLNLFTASGIGLGSNNLNISVRGY